MADLIPQLRQTLPAVLQDAGEDTADRVIEFFTAEIRNENTRKACARAVRRFFEWASKRQLSLSEIQPVHVAAYVEEDDRAPATVKQNLAALRRLFDFLVTGQVLESNPAEPVRSPSFQTDGGKTPALTAEEARELLDSIVAERQDLPQLRDRAIIGVMTYTFARVSAVCGLDVGDYFRAGRRWKIRLHEKGGQRRTVPVHHKAKDYLGAYLSEAGIREERDAPLFQSLKGRTGKLTGKRLLADNALRWSSAGQRRPVSIRRRSPATHLEPPASRPFWKTGATWRPPSTSPGTPRPIRPGSTTTGTNRWPRKR